MHATLRFHSLPLFAEQQKVGDDLRIESRDYLTLHPHEPWMWTLMCACGELDASDIDVL